VNDDDTFSHTGAAPGADAYQQYLDGESESGVSESAGNEYDGDADIGDNDGDADIGDNDGDADIGDNDGDEDNGDNDGDEDNGDNGGAAEQAGIVHRRTGRKPKNVNDADATNWCHDTLMSFLRTVVARNPFAKHSGKISDKWQEIAMDMANSTRGMGAYAVTARPDALRIKFARLKVQLKNFRQSGKSARQSGIASVRERNEQLSAQADVMDECLNLQKDVDEIRNTKKLCEAAAKKRNAPLYCSILLFTLT
jgi:cobalamin biosynthesis protein CobT